MGRRRRIDFEGAWHHVMHRGAGRRVVFRDDKERRIFLRLVGEMKERHGVEVHCFVLMDNHFHLLVRSADAQLSTAMQWLLSNFTRWVNARRSVDGAIFRGRFHGVNVVTERHRHLLIRYLAENPLDLGPEIDPVTYRWSSVAAFDPHSGLSVPWLHRELVEDLYGIGAHLLVRALREPPRSDLDALAALLGERSEPVSVAFARALGAAETAAGLGGSVERKALRVGAALILLDRTGRWCRHDLGAAAGLTASAVASA
ncbi:MAG: transposase, partial [Actinomycetota bacterium]